MSTHDRSQFPTFLPSLSCKIDVYFLPESVLPMTEQAFKS